MVRAAAVASQPIGRFRVGLGIPDARVSYDDADLDAELDGKRQQATMDLAFPEHVSRFGDGFAIGLDQVGGSDANFPADGLRSYGDRHLPRCRSTRRPIGLGGALSWYGSAGRVGWFGGPSAR